MFSFLQQISPNPKVILHKFTSVYFFIFVSVFTAMWWSSSCIKAVRSPSRYLYTSKIPLETFCLQAEQIQLFQPLLIIQVLQSLDSDQQRLLSLWSFIGLSPVHVLNWQNQAWELYSKSISQVLNRGRGSPSSACQKHFSLCSSGGCWPQIQTFNLVSTRITRSFSAKPSPDTATSSYTWHFLLLRFVRFLSACWGLFEWPHNDLI